MGKPIGTDGGAPLPHCLSTSPTSTYQPELQETWNIAFRPPTSNNLTRNDLANTTTLPSGDHSPKDMNQLPRELVDAVLHQCVADIPKNGILRLRLVCRLFDRVLKPFACRTLGLEFSRLSKVTSFAHPQMDALQTVGYHCKSLYIDLMVLRDERTSSRALSQDSY